VSRCPYAVVRLEGDVIVGVESRHETGEAAARACERHEAIGLIGYGVALRHGGRWIRVYEDDGYLLTPWDLGEDPEGDTSC
jgi:hypothetical protein